MLALLGSPSFPKSIFLPNRGLKRIRDIIISTYGAGLIKIFVAANKNHVYNCVTFIILGATILRLSLDCWDAVESQEKRQFCQQLHSKDYVNRHYIERDIMQCEIRNIFIKMRR